MKIGHHTPVNRLAARVVAGKGVHWEPARKPGQCELWEAPPPALTPRPPGVVDITGRRRGYMTALYWYKGGRWVTRCDCGHYELRSAKAMLREPPLPDACAVCRAAHFSKTGRTFGDLRPERERRADLAAAEARRK